MTIQEAKQIRIEDFLASLGFHHTKKRNNELLYKSPIRAEEKTESFSVNTEKNLWHDFGIGEGGNIIALAQCKELLNTVDGKKFFNIAFPNISGGFDTRNPYFKGCVAPKDISYIRHYFEPQENCCVFEGFIDYLSYLTLKGVRNISDSNFKNQDYLILNSVSNVKKAQSVLAQYSKLSCFLDNDEAGKRAVSEITKLSKATINDYSSVYAEHKDLNDFLCYRNKKKEQALKPVRGRRL